MNELVTGRYKILDTETGDVIDVETYKGASEGYWQKTYAKTLAEYFEIAGSTSTNVLAWVLTNKDTNNLLHGTFQEIADQCGTTKATISKLFQKLYKNGFVKKVRNGTYMVHPSVMSSGSKAKGVVVLRMWDDS